jgi:hypothetical protein
MTTSAERNTDVNESSHGGAAERKKLFLSYGRADASELADKLAFDLEQHALGNHERYRAWQDRSMIRGGRSWADQIVEALRSVDGMIAVLSPQAVRTRTPASDTSDSVCLDEIAYARFAANKPIVPVMAILCEPPFEIFRLDYVDFTEWRNDARYASAFEHLLDSVVDALRGESRQRPSVERLQPWDFSPFIQSKRRNFTGREWLFNELETWFRTPAAPALFIVGEPGIGKSAIVSEIIHRNLFGRVLAYHCCQINVPDTLSPGRFVRSIAAMAASRHPAYEALVGRPPYSDVLTESRCDRAPESAFEEGILAALTQSGPPREGSWMLVIDALDEGMVPQGGGVSIVGLLARHVDRFPEWLKVVATSRGEPDVLDQLSSLSPRILRAQDPQNVKDLEDYIAARLSSPAIAARVTAGDVGRVASSLAATAVGNFLYAQQALDAVERGVLPVAELGQLPPGLRQQYEWFFTRQFGSPDAWAFVRPVFEALVAAQEPVTDDILAAASGLDVDDTLPRVLADIAPYLRVSDEKPVRRELFHRSLTEWLTDPDRKGRVFAVRRARGHVRFADGLFAAYVAGRFNVSRYALAHLVTHLSEAARASSGDDRTRVQHSLVDFVLDSAVQEQRLNEPFGMNANLRLAFDTIVDGPPLPSAPMAVKLGRGWQQFRRERLEARRLFALARDGNLEAFERELQLYPADDRWTSAARLMAAWLAIDVNRVSGDELRRKATTGTALDERVAAVYENRPAVFEPLTEHPAPGDIVRIFAEVGGSDAEYNLTAEHQPLPGRGLATDDESVRYLAMFHAPVLVAYAQDDRTDGTAKVNDYIRLNAANAYRVYRNGSLWEILQSVVRHRDLEWVKEVLPPVIASALVDTGRDFADATHVAVLGLRARIEPSGRAFFDGQTVQQLAARPPDTLSQVTQTVPVLPLSHKQGDPWADHKRSLCAWAEARSVLLHADVAKLLDAALQTAPGYAGFRAPASLTLAESLAICNRPRPDIDSVIAAAHASAQKIRDLVFCLRVLSRVTALADWWARPFPSELQLSELIDRFVSNPAATEFAAVHIVGESLPERRESNVPSWVKDANTLRHLATAFQWPLSDFAALNPEIPGPDATLAVGARVRVPDRQWIPMLAAYFSSLVMRAPAFLKQDRVRHILRLSAQATQQVTALDTILARLLLALQPDEPGVLDTLEQSVCAYQPADRSAVQETNAPPYPMA